MNVKGLIMRQSKEQKRGLMKDDAQISKALKAIDLSDLKLSQGFEARLRKAIVEQEKKKEYDQ